MTPRHWKKWLPAVVGLGLVGWWALAQDLPVGPGRELVGEKCVICHSLDVVVAQRMNARDWDFLVGQMMSYGAPVTDEQRREIVVYLAANFGDGSAAQLPTSADEGAQLYASNCQGCHQANGQGIVGAFPPLEGHLPSLLASPGGRSYLPLVLINGLQGQIQVKGTNYSTPMPGFAALSDAQLATLLNHLLGRWIDPATGQVQPYSVQEIAALRRSLTPQQVWLERQKLGLP